MVFADRCPQAFGGSCSSPMRHGSSRIEAIKEELDVSPEAAPLSLAPDLFLRLVAPNPILYSQPLRLRPILTFRMLGQVLYLVFNID